MKRRKPAISVSLRASSAAFVNRADIVLPDMSGIGNAVAFRSLRKASSTRSGGFLTRGEGSGLT